MEAQSPPSVEIARELWFNRSTKPHEIRYVDMPAATLPVVEAILQHVFGHFYIEFRDLATLSTTITSESLQQQSAGQYSILHTMH
jgi:hypothetical protein